jgi:hypothetical protein
MISIGSVPRIIELTESRDSRVAEQAVWTLANIAGDCHICREYLIDQGALYAILNVTKIAALNPQRNIVLLRLTTWAIGNLSCNCSPVMTNSTYYSAIIRFAVWAISTFNDIDVTKECMYILRNVSGYKEENDHASASLQLIVSDATGAVLNGLKHPNERVRYLSHKILLETIQRSNVVQPLIQQGVLTALTDLLLNQSDDEKDSLKKTICRTVCELVVKDCQAVIHSCIVPQLIKLCFSINPEIRTELIYFICDACNCSTPEQIKYFVDIGCVDCLNKSMWNKKLVSIISSTMEKIQAGMEEYNKSSSSHA